MTGDSVVRHLIAYDGRKIRSPNTQRLHIAYLHPEVLKDESRVELTVSKPNLVARGATEDTRVCYRFFTDTPVTAKYLAIVMKLLNGEGLNVTAYFTDKVKRDRVVWRKTS